MITIPLFEAFVAVGGRTSKHISPLDFVNSVTQKSNEVKKGTLFVALKGERADGHDFIKDAEKLGAVAAVVEYEVSNISIPQFIVPSTGEAMGNLAKIWRGRLSIPVVAVTGSVGKTTTKELIAHVLGAKFNTHKSRENFNNQLGVPIELMRLDREHQCSVVEFGMRNFNQINYLSKTARPNISVITNIGMSHIEILGSRENIALAKSEILEGMDSGGILILNHDDDFFDLIKSKSKCRIISYGENVNADIRITDIQFNKDGNPTFRINGLPITMENCVGKHHAFNSAAAYAVATELGIKQEDIAKQLSTFSTPKKRGSFSKAKNGAILLDSTYNAAPDSIKASLETLSLLTERGKRTIAVIGEMLELGAHSEEAHKHIGKVISKMTGVKLLVTVGEFAKFIGEESNIANRKHFENSTLAAKYLLDEIHSEDIVLIQGSNGVSLNIVVEALEKGEL